MKGIADEPQYSVGLLEGGTALCDVIDNHIYEQTLVRSLIVSDILLWPAESFCHSFTYTSLPSSVWEECVLRSRPGSHNEAARSLANTHAPDSTLLHCPLQQQSSCYWGPCCSWHWIHMQQQGTVLQTLSISAVSSRFKQWKENCSVYC